jgi:Ca2+-binding RTX toxin-like protein
MFTAGDTLTEAVGEGSDTVRSSSAFTLKANFENLTLGGGANIAGTGNTVANKLIGNTGNNLLKGLGGRDVLTGNGGNDTLDGGAGNDILIGSGGADTFSFSTALTNNVDTVRDFAVGVDKLRLDDDIFTMLTGGAPLSASAFVSGSGITSAQDDGDRIAYDTSTGKLYYDADGFGGNDAVQFAVLGSTTHPALTSTDFVIVT